MNSKTIAKYARIPEGLWEQCYQKVISSSPGAHNFGQESFIPPWVFSFVAQQFLEYVQRENKDGLIRRKSHFHPVDMLLLFLAWFRSSGPLNKFSYFSAGDGCFSSTTL